MALIAVDMTPAVPWGDNGGAKPLIMELLKGFKQLAVENRFLILTASWNHRELAILDSPVMKRLCVVHRERFPEGSPREKNDWQIHFQNAVLGLNQLYHKFFQSRSLRKHGVDLLFCPFTDPVLAESGIPVVSVIHDLQFREFPHFFSPHEVQHRQTFMKEASRKADAIVCVSEYTRRSAIQSLSIPPEKTCVIPNCIQGRLRRLSPEAFSSAIERLGILRHPYMFYPANFWPHKNHRMLLTAYGMYRSRHSDQPLDLVFTGALTGEQQKLKVHIERMRLDRHVHFLGYLSENDLSAVWEGCSCLIFPSLFEGFGIPVLEAMNFDKPVLCSHASSLPEVAGDAALFFDPRKPEEILHCIEVLMSGSEIRTDLIEKGRRRLESFQSESMVRQYLSFFHQTLQKTPQHKNSVAGVFADFWTSKGFNVTTAPGASHRSIELTIELPAWTPHPQTILRVKHISGSHQQWKINRGEEVTLHIPVPDGGDVLSFEVKQTFCPKKANMGEDSRNLGVRCHCCLLRDGQRQAVLWPIAPIKPEM